MGICVRSCLLVLSLCCLLHLSAASKKQHPAAVVVGTVFCDTCFHQELSKSSHFISGASVAVECRDAAAKTSFRKEVKTDRHGVFRVRLPAEVGRQVKTIKACSVKLVKSSEPFCAVAASATSSELRPKSTRNGVHVYSAGFFTFKPLKQPELCYQKPEAAIPDQKLAQPAFFFFPAPPIFPSPNIGGVPLPPNPFLPPPSILPPNPLQPPPASVLPPLPLPFQPSPPPFLGIPPIPLLTPPPPPPAFLLPPLLFIPNPLIPGLPPIIHSNAASP